MVNDYAYDAHKLLYCNKLEFDNKLIINILIIILKFP